MILHVVILVVVCISIVLHFDFRKANSHTRKVAKGKLYIYIYILATTLKIRDKYKCHLQFRHFGNPKKYAIDTH